MYAGALNRKPTFVEYASDHQLVIGGAMLESSRTLFARNFVERAEFAARCQANTTPESFVDAVIQNVQIAGVDLSGERANLIGSYNRGDNVVESRAEVVRAIADNAAFKQSQYNAAFVLSEYFSYLRRDPDRAGYQFWLIVLNNSGPDNYHAMVCAFITSTEYQRRFSQVVSHSNSECAQ